MSRYRRIFLSAAAAACVLFAATPARADLGQGDVFDAFKEALEEYFEELVEPAFDEWLIGKVIGWENFYFLKAWLERVGAWGNSHLDDDGFAVDDLYNDPPEVYSPVEVELKAAELYEDRSLRVQEAMSVTSGIIRQNPSKQVALTGLEKMSVAGCATSINPCIAAGNATLGFMAQEMVQNTNALAQLSQVIVDDHMREAWATQVQNDQLREYLGEYRWSGQKRFAPSTIPTPW